MKTNNIQTKAMQTMLNAINAYRIKGYKKETINMFLSGALYYYKKGEYQKSIYCLNSEFEA